MTPAPAPMAAAPRTRLIWIPIAGVGLVLGLLALASTRAGSLDDAFVVLTYARRLAEAGDFVYNAGEGPLDGFTSLLDVLLKAAVLALAPGDGVRTLWLTTGVLYLAALGSIAAVGARLGSPPGGSPSGASVSAALALVLCPGLAEGTAYMLETPLYLALLAPAALVLPGPRPGGWGPELRAAALALALVLARPEGAPVAAVLMAGRAWPPGPGRWRAPAVLALGLAAYLAWRLALFGYWAPNSYYAKTASSRHHELLDGLAYLGAFLTGGGQGAGWKGLVGALVGWGVVGATLLGPLAARALPPLETPSRRRAACLAGATLAALGAVLVSGGDAYPGRRLLAPVALLALLLAAQVAGAAAGRARALAIGLLLALAGLRAAEVLPGAGSKLAALARAPRGEEDFACERAAARWLARLGPRPRVAHRHFQALKFFAPELHVVDLTGLNDRAIAHAPVSGPVRFGREGLDQALERGVEVIHLHHERWSPIALGRYPLSAVLADPDLARATLGEPLPADPLLPTLLRDYRTATLLDACGPGAHVNLLVRADWARGVADQGLLVGEP